MDNSSGQIIVGELQQQQQEQHRECRVCFQPPGEAEDFNTSGHSLIMSPVPSLQCPLQLFNPTARFSEVARCNQSMLISQSNWDAWKSFWLPSSGLVYSREMKQKRVGMNKVEKEKKAESGRREPLMYTSNT